MRELSKEETDRLFAVITSNGCREMEETRFHQGVNEAIRISSQLKPQVKPATCEHNFQIARNGYFKSTGEIGTLGLPTYKQDIVYCMLYCTKCGETKEIITS